MTASNELPIHYENPILMPLCWDSGVQKNETFKTATAVEEVTCSDCIALLEE